MSHAETGTAISRVSWLTKGNRCACFYRAKARLFLFSVHFENKKRAWRDSVKPVSWLTKGNRCTCFYRAKARRFLFSVHFENKKRAWRDSPFAKKMNRQGGIEVLGLRFPLPFFL